MRRADRQVVAQEGDQHRCLLAACAAWRWRHFAAGSRLGGLPEPEDGGPRPGARLAGCGRGWLLGSCCSCRRRFGLRDRTGCSSSCSGFRLLGALVQAPRHLRVHPGRGGGWVPLSRTRSVAPSTAAPERCGSCWLRRSDMPNPTCSLMAALCFSASFLSASLLSHMRCARKRHAACTSTPGHG